ncbi:hypothetical protein BUALT_Bualt17G0013600 [Buddleja alternifolia]|uniref:Transposase n=1 Tax=Buddleja alternifolia TaxID=168488 RepID=A0AAV6WDU1_9LAMI|nr:hypothetical protein BUALT_Bualt17G0013600 [Buddleja alternifolia]
MSKKMASNMRWHKDKRKDEVGTMRHPADSPAWKHFDDQYPHFSQDPRNVKLGLATDGFTPWSNLGNSYSMWPVILVAYNLPPYECMKEEFLMMSLLILGPRSPGKDIDVYLRPLVDELKELWGVGVETYDVSSKEMFQMHAAILWTISDFPGYGSISGWVTSGYWACPCCFDQTRSRRLRTKTCFMGHRCFLAKNHSWRRNKMILMVKKNIGQDLRNYQEMISVKFPDGVAGNISRCIKANKISGLKSHDCHVLLQRLIPAGVRGYLSKEVNGAIFELGEFFRELCSKTLKVENIERYLGTLKGFVRNRARPEGSIAEGYIVKECLTFMSMYVNGIETKFNRRRRNYDGPQDGDLEGLSVFSMRVRPFRHIRPEPILSDEELEKAHRFVLSNCDEVEHYLNTYKAELLGITLEEASEFELHDGQMKQFPEWFKEHMNSLHLRKDVEATEELWALANGPFRLNTKCYSGCMVNEVRFHTKDCDTRRTTQNSGLVVEGQHKNRTIEFLGVLHRVVELTYLGGRRTVLFECEWFDTGSKKTTQVDRHFISIDVSSRWYKNDPFVLPIQVQQVFYINDIKFGKNWQLVQRVQHRYLWELPELDIEDDCDGSQTHAMSPLQQFESIGVSQVVEGVALMNLASEDVEPVILDENTYKEIWHARHLQDEADEELHSEEGPGAGGLKRIRNMRSSKTVLNSSSATVVKRKLLASNSSPPTSPIQEHSQDRHGLSLGQNLTTHGIQNDLEQNIGSSSTKPRESDGLKRIRLMRSSKKSLNYSKNPSLSESTSQAHSQDPQCGSRQDLRSSPTLSSREEPHNGSENSPLPDIALSAGSRGATQDRDSSSPLNSATAGHSDNGIETSFSQNGTGSATNSRKGRGVAKGYKLDREVKKHGKYKIMFAPGERIPMKNESEFSNGLSIVIKTNAEIHGVNRWRDVPMENKEVCYARLFGWSTDERVSMIVDSRLQTVYTRWRNTLHMEYKKLVNKGISPREVCPREDLSMTKWQAACDFIEDEKFQKKSRINSRNRKKKPFDHTSGKTAMLTRYRRMEKMVAAQNQPVNEDEEPPSEDVIIESNLGRRSGYIKGMGHGVELETAQDKIVNLTDAYEEQSKTLKEQSKTLEETLMKLDDQKKETEACKEQNKTYSQQIDSLQCQMAKMQEFLQKFPGFHPSTFSDTHIARNRSNVRNGTLICEEKVVAK